MSEKEKEFVKKLKKGKKGYTNKTIIWLIAFLIAFSLIVIGALDYQADYQTMTGLNDASGAKKQTVSTAVNPYRSNDTQEVTLWPWETVIYGKSGENKTVTIQPIFGFASYKKVDGGFLPDSINLTIHDWITIAMIIFLGIPSFLIYEREGRRLAGIDRKLPDLLREIADSQRIGMHLPRAISEAAKRNYGPITSNLKKLAAKISWGIPFREAMMTFRNELDTPLARQATILILEAERSGGELEKIFDSAKDYVQELLDIKTERENAIKPYIYIILVSYFIFAVVIFVLFNTFFAPFGKDVVTINQTNFLVVPLGAFKVTFLYMLLTQAFFSGLTAGKMGKGSIKLGLSYSTVLMLLGLLIHKYIILGFI